ncbi:hypothetical protein BH11ACT8_BH11ACT8_35680 [soil metagenome]
MHASSPCPHCAETALVDGVIVGRSPGVKFKKSQGIAGDLTGTPVTKGFMSHSAPAWRCSSCGCVVVPPLH